VNPAQFEHLFPVAGSMIVEPAKQLAELNALLIAADAKPVGEAAAVTDQHRAVVEKLRGSERKAIWLGALAQRHPQFGALRAACAALAAATGAQLGVLAEGGNAAGAWLAGVVPHAPGRAAGINAAQMLSTNLDALLLWDCEPWADSLQPRAMQTLRDTKFIVAATPFASAELLEVAHVLLPIGTFAETSGTYVNLEGRWQDFTGAAQPVGQARPGWKVLRVLGNLLGFNGFEYLSSDEVREELKALIARGGNAARSNEGATQVAAASAANIRVVDVPSYQIDAILRRAPALQESREGRSQPVTFGGEARS
jgi:NADH-quinone oxidoreductase subunit G